MRKEDRYPIVCLVIYIIVFLIGAIKPWYFLNWVLESSLPLIFVFLLIKTYKRFRFSNLSYTCMLLFLILHTIGAHYTYSLVPLTKDALYFLGLSRNFYDWIVHFLFGLLMYFPAKEFLNKNYKSFSKKYPYLGTVFFLIAAGILFEIIEWGVYLFVGDEKLTTAFIAAQGETFYLLMDSFVDLALNLLGSLLAAAIFFVSPKKKN